jgi:Ca2+-transporting ATPase
MTVIYWPPLQSIFKTTALTAGELVLCIALSTIVFWAVEAQKLLTRWREGRSDIGSESIGKIKSN